MTISVAAVAAQIGSTLLPDNDQWVNRFQVKSTTSASRYTIAQRRSDKVWGCSCPGWTHYRRCRHLKDVLERLSCVSISAASDDKAVLSMLKSARTAYLDLEPAKAIATPDSKGRILDL